MNYCEKCNVICDENECQICGNKELREVLADDFCLLTEANRQFGESFKNSFEQEGKECVFVPCGSGFLTQFGLPLENNKIYVQYKDIERGKELVEFFSTNPENERIRKQLLDNYGQWYFKKDKTAKKIRKKFKLEKDADVMAFVRQILENAAEIEDKGPMTTADFETKSALIRMLNVSLDGYTIKTDEGYIWFVIPTYEIQF